MILFDLDDFSPAQDTNALNWLVEMRNYHANLKVTLFTILGDWVHEELLQSIKFFDFIELAAHGYYHNNNKEVLSWNKDDWFRIINLYEKNNLFVKLFKAPNWEMSPLGYHILHELGWAVAVRENQIKDVPMGMKYYSFEEQGGVHGHTWLFKAHKEAGTFDKWFDHSEFGFISQNLKTKT